MRIAIILLLIVMVLLRNAYRNRVMDWRPLGFNYFFIDDKGRPAWQLEVQCSECGHQQMRLTDFCPSCGRVWCYHIRRSKRR